MFEDFRRSFVELVSAVRDMFSSTAQRGQTLAGAFEEMTPEQRRVALVELETDREMLKLAYLGVLQQREELQEARCWHLNNGLDRCVHCGEVVEWSFGRDPLAHVGLAG